jgi:hypothetical protein
MAALLLAWSVNGVEQPSAVGRAALRRVYDTVCKAITLKVKFTIAELVVMFPMGFCADTAAEKARCRAIGVLRDFAPRLQHVARWRSLG